MAPAKKTGSSSRSRKTQVVCRTCGKRLPLSDFGRRGTGKKGKTARQPDCKACMRKKIRRGRKRTKERRKPSEATSEILAAELDEKMRQEAKDFLTAGEVDGERVTRLAEIVFLMIESGGCSFEKVAADLEVSIGVVRELWWHGRNLCMDPTHPSGVKEFLTRFFLDQAQSLSSEGASRKDLELARSYAKDAAQLHGLLSTGNNVPQTPVNVGVQVNVAEIREIEDKAVQYLEARQKELEAP